VIKRPPRLASGERPLARAVSGDGVTVAGTRDALHLGERRIPWETVEKADWDAESETLTVTEVGTWGEPRPVHRVQLQEPGRLLQLVRERVTASVVLQRHVPVRGRRGFFVVARRAPRGNAPLQWVYEFEEGIDPEDPQVRRAAEEALAVAQQDVGLP
jgi:hypothetical protein